MAFDITRSKRRESRSLQFRAALILCAVLFITPFALADTKSAIDKLMENAIIQSQTMVALMTQSCSGGEHGVNPGHYDDFVKMSNDVQKKLVDLRLQLAKGQQPNAGSQIDAVEATLEQMVALMHQQCSGGGHGVDPAHYGDLVNIKQRVLGSLDAVKAILVG